MLSLFAAPGAEFLEFYLPLHFLLVLGSIITPVLADLALQGY